MSRYILSWDIDEQTHRTLKQVGREVLALLTSPQTAVALSPLLLNSANMKLQLLLLLAALAPLGYKADNIVSRNIEERPLLSR